MLVLGGVAAMGTPKRSSYLSLTSLGPQENSWTREAAASTSLGNVNILRLQTGIDEKVVGAGHEAWSRRPCGRVSPPFSGGRQCPAQGWASPHTCLCLSSWGTTRLLSVSKLLCPLPEGSRTLFPRTPTGVPGTNLQAHPLCCFLFFLFNPILSPFH